MKNRTSTKNSASKYLGVSYCTSANNKKKYRVNIQDSEVYGKRNLHLGYYLTEQEGAYAYNYIARIIHGEYANLNVIEEEVNNTSAIEEYLEKVIVKYGIK